MLTRPAVEDRWRSGARRAGSVTRTGLVGALWSREPGTPVRPPGAAGTLLLLAYAAYEAWASILVLPATLTGRGWSALWPVVALHLVGVVLSAWRPLLGWRLVVLALLAGVAVDVDLALPQAPDLLWAGPALAGVLVLVGLSRPAPAAVAAGLLTAAAMTAAGASVTAAVWTVVPMAVALAIASRNRARSALAAEQVSSTEARTERAVLAERARIAREMHDTIAHHMSLIAVRCETAPYRLAELPGPARAELAEVGAAARAALAEMQAMLGVLRTGDHPAERAPQPGLAQLPGLLRDTAAAGTEITADVPDDLTAEPDAVPAATGLAAFRVVQQALSNAGQHARGAPVEATVRRVDGELRIVVANGPGGRSGTPGGGRGLSGLRERVEALGGGFAAGPTPGGGFAVRATLPVRDAG